MRHHRNAAVDEIADGLGHAPAALELDGAAVGLLHHARGIAEGDRRALLVGAERHVDDDQRALGAAHHGAAMHDHQLERHRHGRLVAVHHHAEAVADQQEIAVLVGDRRGMGVIGGQRDDRLDALLGGDVGGGDALDGGLARTWRLADRWFYRRLTCQAISSNTGDRPCRIGRSVRSLGMVRNLLALDVIRRRIVCVVPSRGTRRSIAFE